MTPHLCQKVPQANDISKGGAALTQSQLWHLKWSISVALALVVSCLQDAEVFQSAQAPAAVSDWDVQKGN